MTSATKKRPILVVDDEPDMLCSLQDLLRRDFAVHTAPSGAAGYGEGSRHGSRRQDADPRANLRPRPGHLAEQGLPHRPGSAELARGRSATPCGMPARLSPAATRA